MACSAARQQRALQRRACALSSNAPTARTRNVTVMRGELRAQRTRLA